MNILRDTYHDRSPGAWMCQTERREAPRGIVGITDDRSKRITPPVSIYITRQWSKPVTLLPPSYLPPRGIPLGERARYSILPPNILGFSSKTSNPTQEYYHDFSLLLECRTHGQPKVSLRIYKAYHHCFEYIIWDTHRATYVVGINSNLLADELL